MDIKLTIKLFEEAGKLDHDGKENEAIPLYKKAINFGLPREHLPFCYVQLGSSLRNVGRQKEAIKLLTKGFKQFPENISILIFLCFSMYDLNEDESLYELIQVLKGLKTNDVVKYKKSINYYFRNIK